MRYFSVSKLVIILGCICIFSIGMIFLRVTYAEAEYDGNTANSLVEQLTDTGNTLKEQLVGEISTPAHYSSSTDMSVYDLMGTKPIRFLPNYKNPCWYGEDSNGPVNDNTLHCLPYFFIIGVKKSGTSDLMHRLKGHPDIQMPGVPNVKELQWFTKIRFSGQIKTHRKRFKLKGKDYKKLEYYVTLFDRVAKEINAHKKPMVLENGTKYIYHHRITVDASPSYLDFNYNWDKLPGNEGLVEPRYTTLDYIRHTVPDAKIIVIFRDPVTRLFSDYVQEWCHSRRKLQSPSNFHKRVQMEIQSYNECFKVYTLRRCIYNGTLYNNVHRNFQNVSEGTFRFNSSFYAFKMKELLNVFHPSQIMAILSIDYINDMEGTLRKVFDFLGLTQLSSKEMQILLNVNIANEHTEAKSKFGQILPETNDILYEFFKPFNEEMAHLMNDSRYRFPQNESEQHPY